MRVSNECTGDCPLCVVRLAFPYTYRGAHGYVDVCKACAAAWCDELVAEIEEADALMVGT